MIQVFPTSFPPQNTPAVDNKGTVTNAFMAFFRDLYNRTGAGSGLVNQVDDAFISGNIITDWVNVINGPATLPALTGGQMVVVQNFGLGPLAISPPPGATIDRTTGYSIPGSKMQIFWWFSATDIRSTQLG